MLTATIRFYVTQSGIVAALLLLARISYTLGRFRQAFDEHLKADQREFTEINADIRELRARRR